MRGWLRRRSIRRRRPWFSRDPLDILVAEVDKWLQAAPFALGAGGEEGGPPSGRRAEAEGLLEAPVGVHPMVGLARFGLLVLGRPEFLPVEHALGVGTEDVGKVVVCPDEGLRLVMLNLDLAPAELIPADADRRGPGGDGAAVRTDLDGVGGVRLRLWNGFVFGEEPFAGGIAESVLVNAAGVVEDDAVGLAGVGSEDAAGHLEVQAD